MCHGTDPTQDQYIRRTTNKPIRANSQTTNHIPWIFHRFHLTRQKTKQMHQTAVFGALIFCQWVKTSQRRGTKTAHFDYKTCFEVILLYTTYSLFQPCSSLVPGLFQPCSNTTMFQPSFNHVPTMFQPCSNHVPTMFQDEPRDGSKT